jgi:uncharacterized protein YndB with AHSA1/START domain
MDERRETSGDVAVERSIQLSADPSLVWQHVTEGELLSTWMEGSVEIEPRAGGVISMTEPGGATYTGVVDELDPGRRLQWEWRSEDGMPARVEIEIEPLESGTRLTIRETLLHQQVFETPPQRFLRTDSPHLPDVESSARIHTVAVA